MLAALAFRHQLAARLLVVAGAASLAPAAACGSSGEGGGQGGADAGPGATSSGKTGGSTVAVGVSTSTGTTGTGGGGGAGGQGGGGGAGGASCDPSLVTMCFDPSDASDAGDAGDAGDFADAGACPPVGPAAVKALNSAPTTCMTLDGWEALKSITGPTVMAGQCCYGVTIRICPGLGRPYLVEGEARRAEAITPASPDAWSEALSPTVDDLSPSARASLAAAWTEDGLLEHASVASFARFSLSLMAAGAPADLLGLAHEAALDEVRHARLCFALAGAYAGKPVAPGAFPLSGSVEVPEGLAEIAAAAVREGCLGEAVAAVLAAEQLARATDPAVRAVLERIAADEARHAELAFRTVAWALGAGGPDVRAAVEEAFAVATAPAPAGPPPACGDPAAMEAHGRLGAPAVGSVIATALREVVLPCARALLQRAG